MLPLLDLSAKTMGLGYLKSYGSHILRFTKETMRFGLICKKATLVLQWLSLKTVKQDWLWSSVVLKIPGICLGSTHQTSSTTIGEQLCCRD
jgi:hypothetical protein